MQDGPKISTVVSVEDHPVLSETFEALARQTVTPSDYEVVVVDAKHVADWEPVFQEFMQTTGRGLNFRFYKIPKGGRAQANNFGVLNTSAPLVVFLVDDFVPKPNWLEAHLRFHREYPQPHAVAVGPAFFPPHLRDCPFRRWLEDSGSLFGVPFTAVGVAMPKHFFYVGNASMKRAFFSRVGPFDEDFPYDAWDDYEMSLRLSACGMKAMYVADAETHHVHAITLGERRETMRRAGESAAILERKYPGTQPWHEQCRVAPWRHRLRGLFSRTAFVLTRDVHYRKAYYRDMLAADFVAGYQHTKSDQPLGSSSRMSDNAERAT